MKFSKIIFAVFSALIVLSIAFEEGEEACPDYGGEPDCNACVSANCGYVIDEGDCVKDCLTVKDSLCFSFNVTEGEVEDVCTKAMEAKDEEAAAPTEGEAPAPAAEPAPAPAPTTSSADSIMTSLVQWFVLVAGVGLM